MKTQQMIAALALVATLASAPVTSVAAQQAQASPQQTQTATPPTPSPASPQTSASPAASQPSLSQQTERSQTTGGTNATTSAPATSVVSPPSAQRGVPARATNPAATGAQATAPASEDAAVVEPLYRSYLNEYRLGPEDVISVFVFGPGLDRYNRTGVIIPPDGRLYHYLIPEGVLAAGKTTAEVTRELTQRFNEYIIEPRVSVILERAMSARYSVIGDVTQPGIRTMTRRLSVYEAISEAGGVTSLGNRQGVVVVRRRPDNTLQMIPVNIAQIERGRARDEVFLQPGDQVVVPGSRFRHGIQAITSLIPILSFARIFAGGF